MRSFKNKNKIESQFAKHLINKNHSLNDNNRPIALHIHQKGRKLNLLEQLEINNIPKDNLINEQINIIRSPLLDIFKPKTNINPTLPSN